jgi:hypothetical protein
VLEGVGAVNPRPKRVFLGVFLIIVPPMLALLSAAMSVSTERHVREGRIESAPYWTVLFPLALVATFVCIPLGIFVIFKALQDKR